MKKPQSPADLINADLELLSAMVKNLLVNNINFKNGYYFSKYPGSERFVREVLRDQAEHILIRIDEVKERVSIEIGPESDADRDDDKIKRLTEVLLCNKPKVR